MAASLVTLGASIVGGLLTFLNPPAVPTLRSLLNSTSTASEFAKFLDLSPYSTIYDNISFTEGFHITFLAPANVAFAGNSTLSSNDTNALLDVLRYHVLQRAYSSKDLDGTIASTWLHDAGVTNGQAVSASQKSPGVTVFTTAQGHESTILSADIPFQGGFLHTIDSFLIPPQPLNPSVATTYNITSFLSALNNASLTANITTACDVTIFAPSDEAFAALDPPVEQMSVPDLASLLKGHVVDAKTYVVNGTTKPFEVGYTTKMPNRSVLQTMRGGEIRVVKGRDGAVRVNEVSVVEGDVLLENGVLHVLDGVLGDNGTKV
ncbi:hypothetical protein ACLMJK_004915 [Lecanora helva]